MITKPHARLTLVLLLAACGTQTYAPKPLEPVAIADHFSARTLADAGLGEPAAWGLQELTTAALRLHPDLNLARAQWRAAQAGKTTAAQRPNPTLSTGGEHHSQHAGGITPWTLNLGIDIPIETHGKREARIEEATALSEAARLDIGQTAWNIRSQVRSRLLDVYAIEQQVAQLQREEALQLRIVSLLEARVNAGMTAGTDLSDAKLAWQKSHLLLETEQAGIGEARAALAAAIGLPDTALENVTLSYASFDQPATALPNREVQRAALQNRLDIRRALARYDAAEARLKLEITKQHPDFSLSPGLSWDQADFKWSLGLSLILALFNKNEGPIAEANAAREVEARRFESLQATVIGEQAQARARWQAAMDDISKARQLVNAQHDRLRNIQRQFAAGYADRLELTTNQLQLVGAEAAVLAARLRSLRALGALEDTIQQPLDGTETLANTFEEDARPSDQAEAALSSQESPQ